MVTACLSPGSIASMSACREHDSAGDGKRSGDSEGDGPDPPVRQVHLTQPGVIGVGHDLATNWDVGRAAVVSARAAERSGATTLLQPTVCSSGETETGASSPTTPTISATTPKNKTIRRRIICIPIPRPVRVYTRLNSSGLGYAVQMWLDSWVGLIRVLLVGSGAYILLVAVLRMSGKRTLTKLNAFDLVVLVVTVALGSTLATILLSSDVSWAEGAVALVLLVALQYVAAKVSSRFTRAKAVLNAGPTLLVDGGTVLEDALTPWRVSLGKVRQAIRASGVGDVRLVAAVVLETDGSISVITTNRIGDGCALNDVPNRPREDQAADRRVTVCDVGA